MIMAVLEKDQAIDEWMASTSGQNQASRTSGAFSCMGPVAASARSARCDLGGQ